MSRRPSGDRKELLRRLAEAAERSSADGILFHQAVADGLGLHVTDLRCLSVLRRIGEGTAGDLARHTGLSTAAVTRMLDRLESAGFIRREHDTADRRRVIVRVEPSRALELERAYRGMSQGFAEVLSGYTDAELRTFLDLFDRLHELSQAQLERLRSRGGD